MYAYNSNASKEIKYPDLPGNKLFNTFQHVDKSTPYLLTCYYVMPNQSDPPNRLFPQDINASLCSHIIISFAVVRNCTIPLPNEYEATVSYFIFWIVRYKEFSIYHLSSNKFNLKIYIVIIRIKVFSVNGLLLSSYICYPFVSNSICIFMCVLIYSI